MMRPPRPKYPSDTKNYHESRRPGFSLTVRLPEELLDKYVALKNELGPHKSHANVIRFLFEAAEPAIANVLQERSYRVVIDSNCVAPVDVDMQGDPDGDVEDEIDMSISDSGGSDCEIEVDPGQVAADSEDDDPEPSCCIDSHSRSPAQPQVLSYPEATYAFWSKNKKQTRSSWRIESQALEQTLKNLEDKGLTIEEVIHDDNATVDSILSQHNIMSQKDLWHKCKNLMSKFKESLQEKRRSPNEGSVEGTTTVAQVAVISVQQLRDFCHDNNFQTSGSKLALISSACVVVSQIARGGRSHRDTNATSVEVP
ncbi:hypothetical protein R1sor_014482 [Riccia sorocarpa]|uniref:Uncharacterized protein n=1 Tax=Riccia sorocarpa TaxID=122646 RepID=A0ABD3H9H4_9MARC